MKKFKLVIIGGGPGGVQAAISAQRYHELKDILVVRHESKAVIPCSIPYIYGTLGSVDKNLMPDRLLCGAKVKVGDAVSIDHNKMTVSFADGERIGYDKLILATGSRPVVPPIPGVDKANVYLVNKDIYCLRDLTQAMEGVRHILVVGGGLTGVEFAVECRKRGHQVTIVELQKYCLQSVYTQELCIRVEASLARQGIAVLTNTFVSSFEGSQKAECAELDSGQRVKCDLVIVCVGVLPNTGLAEHASLDIGSTGGIKVDEFQKTSAPDIFAVGDCAEKYSFFDHQPIAARLASVAIREASIAAANLCSARSRNTGTITVFSTIVGEIAVSLAGLTPSRASELGYDVIVGKAQATSRYPEAIPGGKWLTVELTFDRSSGRLLGGSACGAMTAGEIGNLMASCIFGGLTMEQVTLLPVGTHPWLTASPFACQLTSAAADALHRVGSQQPLNEKQ